MLRSARAHSAQHCALPRTRAVRRLEPYLWRGTGQRPALVRGRSGHATPRPVQLGRIARHDPPARLVR